MFSRNTSRIRWTATFRRTGGYRGGLPGGSTSPPVPAQQRLGPRWYTGGSGDAILQSLNLIYDEDPDYVVVFGADHIYRMDPEQMLQFHIESGAGATVAGIRVPRAEATAFGCIDSDESGLIRAFVEKPADPPGTPPTIPR